MTTATKTVTNEDLLGVMHDLVQMTSEGFDRIDARMGRLETRMDGLEVRMDGLETRLSGLETRMDGLETRVGGIETQLENINLQLRAIHTKLLEHDLQLGELVQITRRLSNNHVAYVNDIQDILDRVTILEERAPDISQEEMREIQRLLQVVVDWAIKTAKVIKVPLKTRS